MPFADYVREAVVAPLASGSTRAVIRARGCTGRWTTCWHSAASSSPRCSSPGRRTTRWCASSSRASTACCRTSGASPRSTGASASSSRARRRATGRARLTSPRTFGHFGGSGTFLWVDPDRGIACAALTTREFGDWAKEAWPPTLGRRPPRARLTPLVVIQTQASSATTRGALLVVGEERAEELVEGRTVAARDDAGRHRRDGRCPRDAHRERHLAERLARVAPSSACRGPSGSHGPSRRGGRRTGRPARPRPRPCARREGPRAPSARRAARASRPGATSGGRRAKARSPRRGRVAGSRAYGSPALADEPA